MQEITDEEKATAELMAMSAAELDNVPFEVARWQCKIKFCKCFTRVRDYGLAPIYYSKRGVVDSETKEVKHWFDSRRWYRICHKHRKYWKLPFEEIPFKKSKHGILWGGDTTGKEFIIY